MQPAVWRSRALPRCIRRRGGLRLIVGAALCLAAALAPVWQRVASAWVLPGMRTQSTRGSRARTWALKAPEGMSLIDSMEEDDELDDLDLGQGRESKRPRGVTGWGWRPRGGRSERMDTLEEHKRSKGTQGSRTGPEWVKTSNNGNGYSVLINDAAARGDASGALLLFDEARRVGARVDDHVFHQLLDMSLKQANVAAWEHWIAQAAKVGVHPSAQTVNAFISAVARDGAFAHAESWATRASAQLIPVDSGSYNALIDAAAREATPTDTEAVQTWLSRAIHAGFRVDMNRILSMLMRTAGKKAAVEVAELWYKISNEIGGDPDVKAYIALIHIFAKQDGLLQTALTWFERAVQAGALPKVTTINILINAAAQDGQLELAEKTLNDAGKYGVAPDLVTYTTLARALARRNDLHGAETWFERAQADGIECDVFMYNTLIDAAAKSGNFQAAENWFEKIFEANIQPNTVTFNTLIHASMKMARPWRAEELFVQMLQRNLKPTAFTLRTLRWALGRQKLWSLCKQEGVDMNEIMQSTASPPQSKSRRR